MMKQKAAVKSSRKSSKNHHHHHQHLPAAASAYRLLSVALLTGLSHADGQSLVPLECLSKQPQSPYGRSVEESNSSSSTTRFDMTEYLAANLHHDMKLLEVNLCL